MAAPAKMPAANLDKSNVELTRNAALPDVRGRFTARAFNIVGNRHVEFAAFIKS